ITKSGPLNLGSLIRSSKEKRSLLAFRNKTLTTPKYGNLLYFTRDSFDSMFSFQGLEVMISDFGPFYPDLVKAFYSNLSIDPGCVVKSLVEGKEIVLYMEDFGMCLSIPHEGERICQGFTYD
ncbi:hypothetical protein KIW84_011029, partial [Lathyrus oleraceus]